MTEAWMGYTHARDVTEGVIGCVTVRDREGNRRGTAAWPLRCRGSGRRIRRAAATAPAAEAAVAAAATARAAAVWEAP